MTSVSHRVTLPPRILVEGLCISILPQFIHNMFRILSIILILVISQSTKTVHRLPLFRTKVVNHTNTGYQPVNEDCAPSSAFPNQGCSLDRPLPARELAELMMPSRIDHLPNWNLAQFDDNPSNWHEWFGQFKSTVDSAVVTDDTKLTYLKTLVTGKAKTANLRNLVLVALCTRMHWSPCNGSLGNHKLMLVRILIS